MNSCSDVANREDLVQANGYGVVAANDEATDNFYIFHFPYIP